MRLIDADSLETHEQIEPLGNGKYEYVEVVYKDDIDNAPTINQWIPVSERLPKEDERVLCTHLGGVNPNRQVIEHIYQNGEFVLGWDMDMILSSPTFGQRYMGKVIAWMPLPEPYEESNDETN